MKYLLILVYSGMSMSAQPRETLSECLKDARSVIGTEAEVKAWDNMNGSNPIPKVLVAFCAQGIAMEIAK